MRKPVGAVSLAFIVILAIMGIFAPYIGTKDIYTKDDANRLAPMSWERPFGTDLIGRDFYTQMVYGIQISFVVAFVAVAIAGTSGLVLGIISGYFGGWVDMLIQRLTDVMLSFPGIVLALTVMAVLGQGLDKVILAIAISTAAPKVRVIRGQVLALKGLLYVEAARAIGATPLRIMARHILPGTLSVFLVLYSASLGGAILMEASLSFLGLGVPPPMPSWGRFLSGNVMNFAFSAPHLVVIPGLAITLLVLAFNLFGDVMRDIWDPRLRGH